MILLALAAFIEPPSHYVHSSLKPGGVVRQAVPSSFNAMVHVSIGRGNFGPKGRTQEAREEQVRGIFRVYIVKE